MSVHDLIQASQFLIDADGNKKGVVLEYPLWKELVTLLEDMEDAEEIRHLRESDEKPIPWEDAKAELQAEGIDV